MSHLLFLEQIRFRNWCQRFHPWLLRFYSSLRFQSDQLYRSAGWSLFLSHVQFEPAGSWWKTAGVIHEVWGLLLVFWHSSSVSVYNGLVILARQNVVSWWNAVIRETARNWKWNMSSDKEIEKECFTFTKLQVSHW